MFFKIALNNVKKSLRDYTIYFLTLTFGVCLFYVFNSIEGQEVMLSITKNQHDMLTVLTTVMGYVSIFISIILGFLIVYANRFLIKRRKKELGIYLILGMEKGRVSRILMTETLFIGIFALAVGLAAGIFLSQGLAVVTAKMFEVQMKEFQFLFSMDAFLKSILYFGVIFVVVMIFNSITVSRCRLIDLLSAAKKNEQYRVKKLWISVVLFLVAVALLITAYVIIIRHGLQFLDHTILVCVLLGSAGTFLFFFSLSGFLLRVVQSSKKLYLKGLNMFVLRQINSKITTNFVSMTLICLMLFLTICTLSSGMGLARTMTANLELSTPYDVSLISNFQVSDHFAKPEEMLETLKADGVDVDHLIAQAQAVHIYNVEGVHMGSMLQYYDWGSYEKEEQERLQEIPMNLMPLSDFNRALQLQGKEPIELEENQYAINCTFWELRENYRTVIEKKEELTIGANHYQPYGELLEVSYYTNGAPQDIGTVIVPDQALDSVDAQLILGYCNMQFQQGNAQQMSQLLEEQLEAVYPDQKPYFNLLSKTGMYEQSTGLSTLLTYLAIYIGAIFLITSAAVLAIQQLSESADNAQRYALLRKLGAEEKQINRSLLQQICIYFFMPLSLAVVHAAVGIHVANRLIQYFGQMDASLGILLSAGVIVVVYGGYLVATYLASKGLVRQK